MGARWKTRTTRAFHVIAGLLGPCLCMLCAYADESTEIERLSGFDPDKEVAAVEPQSVRSFATVTVFVVKVVPKDPDQISGVEARREIRYLADCGKRKVALAAVARIDAAGQVMDSHNIAPGAMRYRTPGDGTAEQHWLDSACGAS